MENMNNHTQGIQTTNRSMIRMSDFHFEFVAFVEISIFHNPFFIFL